MSDTPSGQNDSNPQNGSNGANPDPSGSSTGNPSQGDYSQGSYDGSNGANPDPSGSSTGSSGQGDYSQGNYGQGDYGNQYSQADFGNSQPQTAQQPVGSQGDFADYQQSPQAYDGNNMYGAAGAAGSTEKNSLGVISLVSGVVGFVVSLAGIVAIVTGFMSLKAVKNGQANNRGMGLTGLILGFVTTALGLIGIVVLIIMMAVGIGSESNTASPSSPSGETQAPAVPGEDDEAGGDSAPEGEGAKGGDFDAEIDKATKIGTFKDIEIHALITSGKAADTVSPQTFANREVLVIKYFMKNVSDKPLKPGKGRVECFAGGADCSNSVHGQVGDREMSSPILDFDKNPIKPDEVEEFYTAQAIEPKAAEKAEITLLMTSEDYRDRQSFKIK